MDPVQELIEYLTLGKNWDGEGAVEPNIKSIQSAIMLAKKLRSTPMTLFGHRIPFEEVIPEILPHNGNAGLYWNTIDLRIDLELLGDGSAIYYIRDKFNSRKGNIEVPQ